MIRFHLVLLIAVIGIATASADKPVTTEDWIDSEYPKLLALYHWLHQNPELSNREFRTAGIVADHLRGLGMEVTTEVAHTGVIGILRGAHPGPTTLSVRRHPT